MLIQVNLLKFPTPSTNSVRFYRAGTGYCSRQLSLIELFANKIYFICKGKHCLKTSKDDRKIAEIKYRGSREIARQIAGLSKSSESLIPDDFLPVRNVDFF